MREIGEGKLESIVHGPQRSAVRITDTSKTTAGRSVRLEHNEWKPRRLRQPLRLPIDRNKVDGRIMMEIVPKNALRVDDGIASVELGSAIVRRVSFNSDGVQPLLESIDEPRLPDLLRQPWTRGDGWAQELVLDGNTGVEINGFDQVIDFVGILSGGVGDTTAKSEE